MVLQERIELSTSPLPRECSTTELLQHAHRPGGRCPRRRGGLLPQGFMPRKAKKLANEIQQRRIRAASVCTLTH